jgi:hypothetical protein
LVGYQVLPGLRFQGDLAKVQMAVRQLSDPARKNQVINCIKELDNLKHNPRDKPHWHRRALYKWDPYDECFHWRPLYDNSQVAKGDLNHIVYIIEEPLRVEHVYPPTLWGVLVTHYMVDDNYMKCTLMRIRLQPV